MKAHYFGFFFIVLGIFARIWLYLQNGELLMDEAYLAASIYHSSFKDILSGNLPYGQTAPLGFILSVKLLSQLFGPSEYVLRFIPFVSGILLLFLAYSFVKREFNIKTAGIFLFFLSISDPLLFYTVQFKQYQTEALISLIYLNFYCLKRQTIMAGNMPFKLVPMSLILVLFGNTPIFVLCGIFLAILYEQRKNNNLLLFLKNNCVKILIVALSCIAYYYFYLSQINAVKSGFMHSFWDRYYIGNEWSIFEKIPLYFKHYVIPLIGQYFTVISPIEGVNALLFTGCFCGGCYFLFHKKNHIFIAIITTICILLFFHITRFYPIGYPLSKNEMDIYVVGIRLFLYFIPISLIPVSFFLEKSLQQRYVAIFAFCIMAVFAIYSNEWRFDKGIVGYEVGHIVKEMNKFNNGNSLIFMNKGAEAAYLYRQHGNKESREYYILEDESLPMPAGINGDKKEVLTVKNIDSVSEIFNIALNKQKEYLIFLFVRSDSIATRQAKEILKLVQINFPEKWRLTYSPRSGNVISDNAIAIFVDLRHLYGSDR